MTTFQVKTGWQREFFRLVVICSVLLVAACVTENPGGAFKPPSKEDLDNAVGLYVQMTYHNIEKKDYELAMVSVKKALEINPKSPLALNALALTYQHQGDIDKARASFKDALSEDSRFSTGHMNYGQFLFQQKEYKAACEQFQVAASDDFYEARASAYSNLGVCLNTIGDTAGAEAAFTRCLGIEQNNPIALLELADIRFNNQKYDDAQKLFDAHVQQVRGAGEVLSPRALWLGIRLRRIARDPDGEASFALFLKNIYPLSKEYADYQKSIGQ